MNTKPQPGSSKKKTNSIEEANPDQEIKKKKTLKKTSSIPIEVSSSNEELDAAETLIEAADLIKAVTETTQEIEAQKSVEFYEAMDKEQLVDLLESIVKEPDVNAIKSQVSFIKVAFIKKNKDALKTTVLPEEPNAAKPEDPLTDRFNVAFNIYKTNKAKFNEEQDKIKIENLNKKQEIIEQLKILISSEETLKRTYDDFKALQDKWKEIGVVPQKDTNTLWQNYNFLIEKFFDKVKINKELKDLDLKKNMERQIELCEKAEELLLEPSVIKSFKQLQKYHEEWKEIGPVPQDKKEDLWGRFKNATDKINQRRREHYLNIEKEQENNYTTKLALCEQAEEIVSIENTSLKEWRENTDKLNEVFKVWKTIGPVSKKNNTEIWQRFKASLETFFNQKKDFLSTIKGQQISNLNQKINICVQAEAIKTSTDWKRTTTELIRLQGEWKKIGPAPKKHAEKVWQRFRAACDEFFNAKNNYFANIGTHEQENLNKKAELIKKIETYQFGENKNENLETLKTFQREWMAIGHVPNSEKDKLYHHYTEAINKHLDKLDINPSQLQLINFKTKFESIKSDPNASSILYKEKTFIESKLKKLKEDIHVLDNNIGFFAASKNASLIKIEFENKVAKAKEEIKMLEEKLKFIRESLKQNA